MDRKTQIFIAFISLFSSIVTGVIVGLLTKEAAIKSAQIQSNISKNNNEKIIENSREVIRLEYEFNRRLELEKENTIRKNKEISSINYIIAILENHISCLEHDYYILKMLTELDVEKIFTSVKYYDVEKTIHPIEVLRRSLKTYKSSYLDNQTTLRYLEQMSGSLQLTAFKSLIAIQDFRNSDLFCFTSKDISQLVSMFSSSNVPETDKRELSKVYITKTTNQSKKDILNRGNEIVLCLNILKIFEEKVELKNPSTSEKLAKYNKLNKEYAIKYKGLSF